MVGAFKRTLLGAATLGAAAFGVGGAQAQSIAEFYKGKTITHIVGAGAGGAYDLVSRPSADALAA